MQHVTEDLSPVKKKITVVFPAEEVTAAFSSALSNLRRHVRVNGFRPGKVPPEIIEKRFYDDLRRQVSTKLVEEHIGEIIKSSGFLVLSPIMYAGGLPERGKEFSYSMTFEVLPEFEIPDYQGMPVEQEEAVFTDDDLADLQDAMRRRFAEIVNIDEDRAPEDGELVLVDRVTLDENGAVMPDYALNNALITVDRAENLPEMKALLKSMKPGEEKESSVTFPPDYENKELAGRTLRMRITLHGIRKNILPDMDDDFAKQCSKFDTMEELRDGLRAASLRGREERNRAAAQKNLVTELSRQVDFPLPEGMVADTVEMYIDNFQTRLRDMGMTSTSLGTTVDDLRAEMRPEAEQWVRNHLFLLNAARKMGLTVSDRELSETLLRIAEQSGHDYASLRDACERNNLLPKLRNDLTADKAMKQIYAAAAVTMRPPAPPATDQDAENNADSAATADNATTSATAADEERNVDSDATTGDATTSATDQDAENNADSTATGNTTVPATDPDAEKNVDSVAATDTATMPATAADEGQNTDSAATADNATAQATAADEEQNASAAAPFPAAEPCSLPVGE
jgi:trigger factor